MAAQLDLDSPQSGMTRGRVITFVAVLMLGVLSFQLGSSMLNPAQPNIAKTLGVNLDAVSQVTSLFFLAGSVTGVVLGRWSDFIGRRRVDRGERRCRRIRGRSAFRHVRVPRNLRRHVRLRPHRPCRCLAFRAARQAATLGGQDGLVGCGTVLHRPDRRDLLRIRGLVLCLIGIGLVAVFPNALAAVITAVALFGIAFYGLTLTTTNGLGVLLSPHEEPGVLPGVNGAAFSIGADLGIAVVAPSVNTGGIGGFVTALTISIGLTILALVATLFIRPRDGTRV